MEAANSGDLRGDVQRDESGQGEDRGLGPAAVGHDEEEDGEEGNEESGESEGQAESDEEAGESSDQDSGQSGESESEEDGSESSEEEENDEGAPTKKRKRSASNGIESKKAELACILDKRREARNLAKLRSGLRTAVQTARFRFAHNDMEYDQRGAQICVQLILTHDVATFVTADYSCMPFFTRWRSMTDRFLWSLFGYVYLFLDKSQVPLLPEFKYLRGFSLETFLAPLATDVRDCIEPFLNGELDYAFTRTQPLSSAPPQGFRHCYRFQLVDEFNAGRAFDPVLPSGVNPLFAEAP